MIARLNSSCTKKPRDDQHAQIPFKTTGMFNWKVVTVGSSVLVGVAVDVGVHMAVGVSVSVGVGRAPPAAVEECCP